ncbi:MAG: Nif3-like dinuclear metal center hexameric protein [Spirochaetaceae bacterium]|jgi:dinuclear metal center YbgI/SA1388 family protein|nr:Nif3-like dinuclear metal center hexameric protein [Spirochaetaceae bacterium]
MKLQELDAFFRDYLAIDSFVQADTSLNGLQVEVTREVQKIAFAVDASLETFKKAASIGANLLFVHHGLFWGKPLAIRGILRQRVQFLLDNDLGLYACHLPLDAHPVVGNNAGLAELLGIEKPEPFALYHGKMIGFKGRLAKPLTIEESCTKIAWQGRPPLGVYPFGKELNETAAVVSGGGPYEVAEAIAEGIDLYVTGEMSHGVWADIQEAGINMIAGGHHSTEVWGVQRLMEHCKKELKLDCTFIDVPSGL